MAGVVTTAVLGHMKRRYNRERRSDGVPVANLRVLMLVLVLVLVLVRHNNGSVSSESA